MVPEDSMQSTKTNIQTTSIFVFDFQDGSRRVHAIHKKKCTNYKQQLPGHLNHDMYKQTQVEFELTLNSI